MISIQELHLFLKYFQDFDLGLSIHYFFFKSSKILSVICLTLFSKS